MQAESRLWCNPDLVIASFRVPPNEERRTHHFILPMRLHLAAVPPTGQPTNSPRSEPILRSSVHITLRLRRTKRECLAGPDPPRNQRSQPPIRHRTKRNRVHSATNPHNPPTPHPTVRDRSIQARSPLPHLQRSHALGRRTQRRGQDNHNGSTRCKRQRQMASRRPIHSTLFNHRTPQRRRKPRQTQPPALSLPPHPLHKQHNTRCWWSRDVAPRPCFVPDLARVHRGIIGEGEARGGVGTGGL